MSNVLVSLAEYIDSAYSPDREFVDGVVVERNVGERPHSRTQSNCNFFFRRNYSQLWPGPGNGRRNPTAPPRRLPRSVTLHPQCLFHVLSFDHTRASRKCARLLNFPSVRDCL